MTLCGYMEESFLNCDTSFVDCPVLGCLCFSTKSSTWHLIRSWLGFQTFICWFLFCLNFWQKWQPNTSRMKKMTWTLKQPLWSPFMRDSSEIYCILPHSDGPFRVSSHISSTWHGISTLLVLMTSRSQISTSKKSTITDWSRAIWKPQQAAPERQN